MVEQGIDVGKILFDQSEGVDVPSGMTFASLKTDLVTGNYSADHQQVAAFLRTVPSEEVSDGLKLITLAEATYFDAERNSGQAGRDIRTLHWIRAAREVGSSVGQRFGARRLARQAEDLGTFSFLLPDRYFF